MPIVGGFDVHRRQLTVDYLDEASGQVQRGRICPADREALRVWLAGNLAGRGGRVAVEGCTGWRYVVEELARAGITPLLAEPAETADRLRGSKKRAKTDKVDARKLRELAARGELPLCWIPPAPILELRARLELYHDLHQDARAWAQRIHATVFHHGGAELGAGRLAGPAGRARLERVLPGLSPAGRQAVTTALAMLDTVETQMRPVYTQISHTSRSLRGSRVLQDRLYGVGPLTAAALLAWLGGANRFRNSGQAVRFCGLDITVYASDRHRAPGHLSRQGPPVLRWLTYEAGQHGARAGSPDHAYYTQVADRRGGKHAALAQARRLIRHATHILTDLGDHAFTPTDPD